MVDTMYTKSRIFVSEQSTLLDLRRLETRNPKDETLEPIQRIEETRSQGSEDLNGTQI